MSLFRKSAASRAGRKAALSWQTILDQTDEEIETLTGLDLYRHAQEEARNWLRGFHQDDFDIKYRTGLGDIYHPSVYTRPEQRYHQEFLDYVEAFIAAFPSRPKGYPKE